MPRFSREKLQPIGNERATDWSGFIEEVRRQAKTQKRGLHGAARKQMKDWRRERTQRLHKWVETGEMGKTYTNVLARVKDGAVNSAHVDEWVEGCRCADKEECVCGGHHKVRRAAKNGAEVRESQKQYMQDWMGDNKVLWFHFAEGKVPVSGKKSPDDPGHLIARLDADGFDFRRRLVEGLATTEEVESVPRPFRRILPHLQRKDVPGENRKIGREDYEHLLLLDEIPADAWAELWSRTKAGTRGGQSGLHVNMMKALVKEVKLREGKLYQGTAKGPDINTECLTKHVSEVLRQLVSVARILRFHYEQWKDELLYTFIKVPGGVGLEDSRPIGLLDILMKASKAVDYSGIARVWERRGILHGPQFAFRQGKGTEGLLMLWVLANEECYRSKVNQARGQGDLKRAYDYFYYGFNKARLLTN